MTAISTRPPRTSKLPTIVAPEVVRTVALDAGNYDLKYWRSEERRVGKECSS